MSQETNPDVERETEDDELMDPQSDSSDQADRRKGQTTEHAKPPRLEDEGQSGG